MSDKLPDLIDPLLLAERRSVLAGVIKIADMQRLSPMIAASDGDVEIEVLFGKEGKTAIVTGHIKTLLALQCQSCLEVLPWPLDIKMKLGVVANLSEAEQLEIDCEPLLFDGEKLSLKTIIEDEILLALPDFPKHGYDCIQYGSSKSSNYHEQNNSGKTDNPFSVLAKIKNIGE